MQIEVGKILEGKVTGITKFGAFVELETSQKGMVHISEISNTYVNEISEHLQDGQIVKVKVLSVSEDGKIALSIKKAQAPLPRKNVNDYDKFNNSNSRKPSQNFRQNNNSGNESNHKNNNNNSGNNSNYNKSNNSNYNKSNNSNYNKSNNLNAPKGGFEDMLSKFMQSSDEKISDIKRAKTVSRKSGSNKRGR